MLLPSEEKMVTQLSNSGISLTKIRVNPQKQVSSAAAITLSLLTVVIILSLSL